MSAKELAAYIGREGRALLRASNRGDALRVDVRVLDAKTAFGRIDLLVEPLAGAGKAWMSADAVTLYEEAS